MPSIKSIFNTMSMTTPFSTKAFNVAMQSLRAMLSAGFLLFRQGSLTEGSLSTVNLLLLTS